MSVGQLFMTRPDPDPRHHDPTQPDPDPGQVGSGRPDPKRSEIIENAYNPFKIEY